MMAIHYTNLASLVLIVLPLLASPAIVTAKELDTRYITRCLHHAGRLFNLDPKLIWAVKLTESAHRLDHNIKASNRNGSVDRGVMQINSTHDRWLKAAGVNPQHLLNNHCLNIQVGAYILADNITRYGLLNGIAYYNTGVPKKTNPQRYTRLKRIGAHYRGVVVRHYHRLTVGR